MRVGIVVICPVCNRSKQPHGRSAPMELTYCSSDCPGYLQEPRVGCLWPGETEEDFGSFLNPCWLGTKVMEIPDSEKISEKSELGRIENE